MTARPIAATFSQGVYTAMRTVPAMTAMPAPSVTPVLEVFVSAGMLPIAMMTTVAQKIPVYPPTAASTARWLMVRPVRAKKALLAWMVSVHAPQTVMARPVAQMVAEEVVVTVLTSWGARMTYATTMESVVTS